MISNFFTLTLLYLLPIVAAVTVADIYQSTLTGTWAESVAVRPNGTVLITRADVPELWAVDPDTTIAQVVKRFQNVTGLMGLTQIKADKYAVVGSEVNISTATVAPGSNSIYIISIDGSQVLVSDPIPIPTAENIDGITTFDEKKEIVLMADSSLGVIYRLDLKTGKYVVLLDNALMDPAPGKTVGVNKLRVVGNYVYFINSSRGLLCSFRVDKKANPLDSVKVIANLTGHVFDDFVVDSDTKVSYIASNADNEIIKVTSKGNATVLANNIAGTTPLGPTSLEFADLEESAIYVTTSGAFKAPVNGSTTAEWGLVKLQLDPEEGGSDDLSDLDDKIEELEEDIEKGE
jgi:hypothetical protein